MSVAETRSGFGHAFRSHFLFSDDYIPLNHGMIKTDSLITACPSLCQMLQTKAGRATTLLRKEQIQIIANRSCAVS